MVTTATKGVVAESISNGLVGRDATKLPSVVHRSDQRTTRRQKQKRPASICKP